MSTNANFKIYARLESRIIKSILGFIFLNVFFFVGNVSAHNHLGRAMELKRDKVAKDPLSYLYKKLSERIQYPPEAVSEKIEGRTYISFTVGKAGKLESLNALPGPSVILSNEVTAVLKRINKIKDFHPGVTYTLPVCFILDSSKYKRPNDFIVHGDKVMHPNNIMLNEIVVSPQG